ncbi:MAG: S-methyl-5-thioribose-1-phosphate isomerase [Alphaproteobacteria bacterium]
MDRDYETIVLEPDGWSVRVLDQTLLPHRVDYKPVTNTGEAVTAIRDMWVRGAPLIGATAAYGMALAMRDDPSDAAIGRAYETLFEARPTAVNLRWALDQMQTCLKDRQPAERTEAAYAKAAEIAEQDSDLCAAIGRHGVALIAAKHRDNPDRPVNVLTHCNAGALATCGIGTATAPVYTAHAAGIPVHVWVDETRPRNQGAALTCWELARAGVPHTLIADNTGGHLMQMGRVDLCIVGSDRTTASGDVCNKIGTYLKALAAHDNAVPFYAALPSTTIDWTIDDGVADIPIEQRGDEELSIVTGLTSDGRIESVRVPPVGTAIGNVAFDVTPARLVTGIITERGVHEASKQSLQAAFEG